MSKNEWEHGTIVLPSSEFAKVRQAVQQADTAHKERVFELTQEFWKGLTRKQQTDSAEYQAAGRKFFEERYREDSPYRGYGSYGSAARRSAEDEATNNALGDFSEVTEMRYSQSKPARVLKSDMQFPSNRTTSFDAGGHVSFDKASNTVTWDVDENNHAVEHARSSPKAAAFFDAIGKVAWTRGTGGVFTGNDEYRRDDDNEGGGANYVTDAFGPVGADQSPTHCRPYTDSKGVRVTERDLERIAKAKFQAEWEAQRKAQEAYAKSLKSAGVQPRGHKGHAGQYTYRERGTANFSL